MSIFSYLNIYFKIFFDRVAIAKYKCTDIFSFSINASLPLVREMFVF